MRPGEALDLGQTPGSICVPRGEEGPKTFGAVDVRNAGDEPVRIRWVGLAGRKGLRAVGARVFPSRRESQVVADGWPPEGMVREWRRGRPARRALLDPGEVLTLWLGVRAPTGSGTARAVRIVYSASGEGFWQDSVDRLRIAKHACPGPE